MIVPVNFVPGFEFTENNLNTIISYFQNGRTIESGDFTLTLEKGTGCAHYRVEKLGIFFWSGSGIITALEKIGGVLCLND